MDQENVEVYIMAYYSALSKEGNPVICNNMDKCGRHYSKKNMPDRERHILHGITYMWNIKKDKPTTNNESNKKHQWLTGT